MRFLINLRNAALAFVMLLLLSTGAVAVDDTIEITVSNGGFTSPYYKFKVGGSEINVATYEFVRGSKYKFVGEGAGLSVYPFFISDQGRLTASSSFNITSTKAYNTGISAGESLEFQLPSNFEKSLTYYCVPHTSMTNTFKIKPDLTVSPTSLRPSTTMPPTTMPPTSTPPSSTPTANPTATPSELPSTSKPTTSKPTTAAPTTFKPTTFKPTTSKPRA